MAMALFVRYLRRRDLHSSTLAACQSVISKVTEKQTLAGVERFQGARQMVTRAGVHARKAHERKKLVDQRNKADTILHNNSSEKSLGEYRRQFTWSKGKSAGRNSAGRITIFHRGGGAKRLQRRIDMKRSTSSMGIVEKIDYDPTRSSRVALVRWIDGVQLDHRRKQNTVGKFTPPKEILEPTTTTIRNTFSFSSLPEQRKEPGSAPGLMAANVEAGLPTQNSSVKDIFFSVFASSKSKGENASLPFSRSFGLPRIAVAGARPTIFAPQMQGEVGGKSTFSLPEIQKWKPDSTIWAHRLKRKAAVSWQSFRSQETLQFVRDARHSK